MAPPLVLRRLERVQCAIGCKDVGGAGVMITLGDGAPTGGAGLAWVRPSPLEVMPVWLY